MIDPQKPMALVKMGGKSMLLNADDAVAVFKLLTNARAVDYKYSSESYVVVADDRYNRPTLEAFTLEDYAKLTLDTD